MKFKTCKETSVVYFFFPFSPCPFSLSVFPALSSSQGWIHHSQALGTLSCRAASLCRAFLCLAEENQTQFAASARRQKHPLLLRGQPPRGPLQPHGQRAEQGRDYSLSSPGSFGGGFISLSSNTQTPNPALGWPQAPPIPRDAATFEHRSQLSCRALTLSPLTRSRSLAVAHGVDFARFCFCCAKMLN